MQNPEVVTVVADGIVYGGWESVSVSAAMNEAVRDFSIATTEHRGEWKFPPGTAIQIYANADLLVDGFTNAYDTSGSATSHGITIKGRGKGQDFVDSAAVHPTGYFEKKKPDEIAKAIDHWGVIRSEIPLEPIEYWQLEQGETAFSTVERALRPQGGTMMGAADGSIRMTNASKARRQWAVLQEGLNIKTWQASLTDDKRHSDYTVKAQNRTGLGDPALRIAESVRDEMVKRYRPWIGVLEMDGTRAMAKARATAEKERAAGISVSATIGVQGFRDDAGDLFEPNRLIFVFAPILMKLEQDMLIERVDWSQDNGGGSTTSMGLVDPRTYKGQGDGQAKSDPAWG